MVEMESSVEIDGYKITLFQLAERERYRNNEDYIIVGFTDGGILVVDVDFEWPQQEISHGEWKAQFIPQYTEIGTPVFGY